MQKNKEEQGIINISQNNINEKQLQKEMPYFYWLSTIDNITSKICFKLLEYYDNPQNIYRAKEEELEKIVTSNMLTKIKAAKKISVEEMIIQYEKFINSQIKYIPFQHADYPDKLRYIEDPPFAIFVRGELPKGNAPVIAMIGTRKCSEYGKYIAREFASFFAENGIIVVSGMAAGIDGISQRTVLENRGKTIAVLGSGVDVCYPQCNYDIFSQAHLSGGAVISEYSSNTPAQAWRFPPRNRIISGLSDLVLVIEANEKSGTLITVDMALEQGRDVCVIPGRLTDPFSRGCNKLIRQGAAIAVSPKELVEEYFGEKYVMKNITKKQKKIENVTPLGSQILASMSLEIETLDDIYLKLLQKYDAKKCSVTDVMCEMMDLQMKGYIEKVGGGYHLLFDF